MPMRPNTPTALLTASACAWAYVWVVSRTSEGYGGMECDPGACRFLAMYAVKKNLRENSQMAGRKKSLNYKRR